MNYVNAAGQPVDINVIAQKHKPPPKSTSAALKRVDCRDEAKESDGFVVIGYSPEQQEALSADYADAKRRFDEAELRAEPAGTLEEFASKWMAKNKPKRARSKPYEIESAADLCADLMRKAGWLHVRVDELLKG